MTGPDYRMLWECAERQVSALENRVHELEVMLKIENTGRVRAEALAKDWETAYERLQAELAGMRPKSGAW